MTDPAAANPLQQLNALGQGVWLDFVDRRYLTEGGLKTLVAQDGVTGVTSNPAIFEKAMGRSDNYDGDMRALLAARDVSPLELYETLAVEDIQRAADELREVYDRLEGRDGYVSLEVSPYLADDTQGTIAEARRLWAAVDRPNLMIKVPGTPAGAPAIRQLITEGINVNVTLLFSVAAYETVADAYVAGLEARAAEGKPVDQVASVASFFLSRIDSVMDARIDALPGTQAADLKGKIAIANAKRAYARYQRLIASDRWQALARRGAMPQRLLWASTGTKNPDYSDVLYVEELAGPDTVNTMPPATLEAFRDHGVIRPALTEGIDAAEAVLDRADALGLDLEGATEELARDGVAQFVSAFDDLLGAVGRKRTALLA
ncbi:transaldolase [Porphyrobacter sp. GA68]|uniref:transaldolase n=1 Tax=Porphyrobacter sp. GA68 TaxID=2883480 RepID=UPI001D18795E|nr:transaldolase [Porphyrobacter sp. GA68]